ncbi:hypothetical protein [Nostoc sp.]|uniref:hypothetical protein n=1 Tax=Nostoc sp. TaxID=1180 RepID=UPI002FF9DAE9
MEFGVWSLEFGVWSLEFGYLALLGFEFLTLNYLSNYYLITKLEIGNNSVSATKIV